MNKTIECKFCGTSEATEKMGILEHNGESCNACHDCIAYTKYCKKHNIAKTDSIILCHCPICIKNRVLICPELMVD